MKKRIAMVHLCADREQSKRGNRVAYEGWTSYFENYKILKIKIVNIQHNTLHISRVMQIRKFVKGNNAV
jgi:hypothetical protein